MFVVPVKLQAEISSEKLVMLIRSYRERSELEIETEYLSSYGW